MQTSIYQKQNSAPVINKWLLWVCKTGLIFFLAKGLVWIIY